MNETQTTRQLQILHLINTSPTPLSRLQIAQSIKGSKATLARDLANLVDSGDILTAGIGRATTYLPQTNPLLHYIDAKQYFQNFENKTQSYTFNQQVFNFTHNLYSENDVKKIHQDHRSFLNLTSTLPTDIYRRELERFIIELSWKSSQIEGNTYTLLDTEALIKQKVEAAGHPKEEAIMILNHKHAFDLILQNLSDFKKLKLSKILELHQVITKDLEINPGIRQNQVGITGTNYKPLDNEHQLRSALENLISAVNNESFPLSKALLIASILPYIQPFSDGNKRTSRLLANAVLMANDFFPLSYRNTNETDYKKSLIIFYERNSLLSFKQIITEQFIYAQKNYFPNL